MEPTDYLRAVRRRWLVVALSALLGALAGLLSTALFPNSRSSAPYSAKRVLGTQASSTGTAPPSLSLLALFLTTQPIPQRAAARLNYHGDPAVLASKIQVMLHPASSTMDITATAQTPARATAVSNAFADELLAYAGEQADTDRQGRIDRAQARLDALQHQLDDLTAQLGSGGSAAAAPGDTARRLVQAELGATVSEYGTAYEQLTQLKTSPPATSGLVSLVTVPPPPPAKGGVPSGRLARAAIGTLLGLLAGIALALVLDRLNPLVFTRTAVERAFNLPVLAEIPALPLDHSAAGALVVAAEPESAAAAVYRMLCTSLRVLMVPAPPAAGEPHDGEPSPTAPPEKPVVLVTASRASEGTTVTAANLAAAFAEAGSTVLLVSYDPARPRVHQILGTGVAPGLSDYLALGLTLAETVKPTRVIGLSLLPPGTPAARIERAAQPTAQLMAAAREIADLVVIEAPPLLESDQASRLTTFADAVLLVARAGVTAPGDAAKAAELLDRLGAPTAGVVLIGEQPQPPRTIREQVELALGRGGHATPARPAPESPWAPVPGPDRPTMVGSAAGWGPPAE